MKTSKPKDAERSLRIGVEVDPSFNGKPTATLLWGNAVAFGSPLNDAEAVANADSTLESVQRDAKEALYSP